VRRAAVGVAGVLKGVSGVWATEDCAILILELRFLGKFSYMRVGVSEARSALLKRVSNGETVQITRHGVLVAKLVRADFCERLDLKKVVEEIRALRKGTVMGRSTIRELIGEGRRY